MSSQDSPIIERQRPPYHKLILVGLVSLCAAAAGLFLSLYGMPLLLGSQVTTLAAGENAEGDSSQPTAAPSPFSLSLGGESLLDSQYEWSGLSITERVRRGEDFLRSHRPQQAATEFDFVINSPANESTHSGRTYLMYGISQELLGDREGSLRSYREAFRRAQQPWQKACATLRLAHGMAHQEDQWTTAVGVLLSSLLRQGEVIPLSVYNESLLSLSLYMTGLQSDVPSTRQLIDDTTLLVPLCPIDPAEILQSWDQAWEIPKTTIARLQLDTIRKLGTHPNEWLIKIRAPSTSIEDLLAALAQQAGWALHVAESGRHAIGGRSIALNTRELSAEAFLDSLLLPLGADWTCDGKTLQVTRVGELSPHSGTEALKSVESAYQRRAAKYLRFGLVQAQDHYMAPKAYTYLARIELENGNPEAAAGYLQQVLNQFPTNPIAATMWFNLARVRMLGGQRSLALQAFFQSADHMDGALTTGASYLYAGRLLIEEQKPEKAISLLFRSTTLLPGEARGRAALLLATAYLMTNQLSSANQVLWDNQKEVALPQLDDQAAFLTAMIRYRNSTPDRKEFLARTLMTAMTHLDRERLFGESWYLLQAEACRELGIVNEHERILTKQLQKNLPEAQRLQLRLMLGRIDRPADQLRDVKSSAEADTLMQIDRTLRLEREDKIELAIAECHSLLQAETTSNENRLKVLAILGRCYQRLGKHEEAIRCFVGILPANATSVSASPLGEKQ